LNFCNLGGSRRKNANTGSSKETAMSTDRLVVVALGLPVGMTELRLDMRRLLSFAGEAEPKVKNLRFR
jgi:hypothetical protein